MHRVILLCCFVIGACSLDNTQQRQLRAEESRMEVEMDHNQCVSYGFPSGTQEYQNCRKRLQAQRTNVAESDTLSQEVGDDKYSQKLARQKQNPGKVCTSKYCY